MMKCVQAVPPCGGDRLALPSDVFVLRGRGDGIFALHRLKCSGTFYCLRTDLLSSVFYSLNPLSHICCHKVKSSWGEGAEDTKLQLSMNHDVQSRYLELCVHSAACGLRQASECQSKRLFSFTIPSPRAPGGFFD